MKPSGPLTELEKQIWGVDAVRDPVTGVPVENGHGSANHEQRIAAGLRREAGCRDGTPAIPQPVPEPPPPEKPERFLDPRTVHPFPPMTQ
jgi:hypothetical protein